MHEPIKVSNVSLRPVRLWLLVSAAMILLTLIVGGATRLTESGLSIVEWKPVTGVLPPLSQAEWQAEFTKYQAIPQYRELNRGMSLDAFKTIYWWEWSHRLLARLTGAVFLLPLLFFLWRGADSSRASIAIVDDFRCGSRTRGGWLVDGVFRSDAGRQRFAISPGVSSDAGHDDLCGGPVDGPATRGPVRRAWRRRACASVRSRLPRCCCFRSISAHWSPVSMPGSSSIPGRLLTAHSCLRPKGCGSIQPAWRNLFENTLTVQFNHRMVAYAIWALATLHACDAWRSRVGLSSALILAGAITLQAVLGIVTLLHQAPLPLALAHQVLAILVFSVAVIHAERLSHRGGSLAADQGRRSGAHD